MTKHDGDYCREVYARRTAGAEQAGRCAGGNGVTPTELHDRLEALRHGQALLPLTKGQAIAQAVRLRRDGMTYHDIAVAMRTYHGTAATAAAWRYRCRARGVPPAPQGRRESYMDVSMSGLLG
jgi:hypothetical protein